MDHTRQGLQNIMDIFGTNLTMSAFYELLINAWSLFRRVDDLFSSVIRPGWRGGSLCIPNTPKCVARADLRKNACQPIPLPKYEDNHNLLLNP